MRFLPAVEVKVEGNVVYVKGPKGELQEKISELLTVEIENGVLEVKRSCDDLEDREQHGLARTLIYNMVIGVTNGYEKKLAVRPAILDKKGKTLVMDIGYSHPIELKDPEGITTETPDATTIIVKGIDKAVVGNYVANIRAWRKFF